MIKIEKSSNEFNHLVSRVCISPIHAASFTGLDKLYRAVQNHFPALTKKEIRKLAESNLPIRYTNPLEKPSNETRCKFLNLIVIGS